MAAPARDRQFLDPAVVARLGTLARQVMVDGAPAWESPLVRQRLAQLAIDAAVLKYTRLRNVQLGYNVPPKYARWVSATRVYVQAENLFTITGYDGLDPALPAANIFGSAGDIRDQYRGVDRGSYPSNRTFSVGLVTSF